jgi:pimeloyl-ACP methyl ester carboxylesterase
LRSSEGFVFVRPGLHLYSRVLGEETPEAETVIVPNASWLADAFLPLAEAAGKRRLILYDPRSRGRSSAVSNPKQLTLEEDVADLEAVRRFYGVGRFALIGSSYHAAIAALYTMENPERVERLMLVCPITSRRPGEWEQETPPSEVLVYPPGVPKLDEMRREGLDRTDPVAFCRAWFPPR